MWEEKKHVKLWPDGMTPSVKMKEWERPNRTWKQSTSESLICNEKLVKTCALSVIKVVLISVHPEQVGVITARTSLGTVRKTKHLNTKKASR